MIKLIVKMRQLFELTFLENTKVSKAAGLDNLSGRFLKHGAKVLAKPISNSSKFSITCFPTAVK